MIKKLTCLLFVFCFLTMSCREEKLEGHWHVYGILKNRNHFLTLDIGKDTTAILGKCSFFNTPKYGYHHPSSKRLYIPMECNIGDFNYTIVNENTLILNNAYFKNVLVEKQIDLDSSHFIQDYIEPLDLSINPPIRTKDSIKTYPNDFNRLIPYRIYIFEKTIEDLDENKTIITFDVKLELDKDYSYLEDLASTRENGILDAIVFPILADKNTPLKKINSVINKLKSFDIKDNRILIYCLDPAPTNLENPFQIFHYKNINFDNLEQTLQESI